MQRHLRILFAFFAIFFYAPLHNADAAVTERRLALVIGNASYKAKPLATAVNDAALIAQTLQSAGFEVVGARDLDLGLLRKTIREFTDKVASAGPNAVVVVYFSGYGMQLAGENYLVPIGAEISDVADLPARASSLSELMHALAALDSKSTFIILDAARPGPFVLPGQAGGLAWTVPEANMLVAFNSAPGTLARDAAEGYGPYAKALTEMIREGDLTAANVFDRVRLRVHELTRGAQVPWSASNIEAQFKFFERTSIAPVRTDTPLNAAQIRHQAMGALGAQVAYVVALMRDTFDAYTDFLADYWQDPMTNRVRALLAARRESITWQRTCQANEPTAYWSYLERYPRGPHAIDAGRLLVRLGAATTPPSKFSRMDFDVPPPLPDELDYIERPMLILDDPAFGFEPPQPIPTNILGQPPQEILNLMPAATPSAAHVLPVPPPLPLPIFLRIPADAIASPNNAREALGIRPAIDIPAGPERQAANPSPLVPGSANDLANGVHSTSQIGRETTPIENPKPPNLNQEVSEKFASRATAAQTAPTTPAWFTDVMTMGSYGVLPRTPVTDSEAPISAPSMFVPASAGLALQTWGDDGIPSWPTTLRTSPLTAKSAAPLPGQTSPAATLLPQTTGNIPPSTGRSVIVAPAVIGSFSMKQNADTETPSNPPSVNQEAAEEKRSHSIPRLRTAFVTPAWLADTVTARSQTASLRPPVIGSGVSESAPSMFAPASAGLAFQTWRYGLPSLRASAPTARSAVLARSRGELPAPAATLLPQTTRRVPRSTVRSATPGPTVTGIPSKPKTNTAAPSSMAADQTRQRKPPMAKSVPPNSAARTSSQVLETPAPNPQ